MNTEMPPSKNKEYELVDQTQALVPATLVPSKTVRVTAPTDLMGNYEFEVDLDGVSTLVAVPPEGVQKGQTFEALVLHEEEGFNSRNVNPHGIPFGHWRDDLFSCFRFGLGHPMYCLARYCITCALGQVMTRLGLDKFGSPLGKNERLRSVSTFKFLFVLVAFMIGMIIGVSVVTEPYYTYSVAYDKDGKPIAVQNKGEPVPAWVAIVTGLRLILIVLFPLYVLFLIIRTRAHIRRKYAIPERDCHGCEDCCCAFWCTRCTILQMARHTADYERYPASCCTDTGLAETAPSIV